MTTATATATAKSTSASSSAAVSTPAYLLGPWIAPDAAGIDQLASTVLEMV